MHGQTHIRFTGSMFDSCRLFEWACNSCCRFFWKGLAVIFSSSLFSLNCGNNQDLWIHVFWELTFCRWATRNNVSNDHSVVFFRIKHSRYFNCLTRRVKAPQSFRRQEPLVHWNCITSDNICIINNTAVRTFKSFGKSVIDAGGWSLGFHHRQQTIE